MTTETLVSIIGAVGGTSALIELVRFLLTRKASQRQALALAQQAKAEADDKWFDKYEHQLDRMNRQIEFKDKRIEDLNQENADKEERFREQTKRLRECQDREYKTQQENIELRRENEELKIDRERHKCIKEDCPYKEPATEKTRKSRRRQGLEPTADEMPPNDPAPELSIKKSNKANGK